MSDKTTRFFCRRLRDDEPADEQRPVAVSLKAAIPPAQWVSIYDRVVSTADAARAAGIEVPALLQWQRKYRSFNFKEGEESRGRGVFWSAMDVILVRLAVAMTEAGIPARAANWFAGGGASAPKELKLSVVINLGVAIAAPEVPHIVAFHRGGTSSHPSDLVSFHRVSPDDRVGELFCKVQASALGDTATILDLRSIVTHVATALGVELAGFDTKPIGNA